MGKRIFIGSSTLAKEKASYIEEILKDIGAEAEVWFDSDAFPSGKNTIDTLLEKTHKFDKAVFILNNDDKIVKKMGRKEYTVRDNVILEIGLFMGSLGKESVLLVNVENVHIPSDLAGVTRLVYDEKKRKHMVTVITEWYNRVIVTNNVMMNARSVVHDVFTPDYCLHISDNAYKKITHIRLMNLASNLVINPENALSYHMPSHTVGSIDLAEAFSKILSETEAHLDLVLLKPNQSNIKDIQTKIANAILDKKEGALYSALAKLYTAIYGPDDNCFKKANRSGHLNFKVMKTSMPFSIFNVVFSDNLKRYNHVKIDLYSANLSNENDRRSFVIYQEKDPENYEYFIHNFDNIFQNPALTEWVTESNLKRWSDTWEKEKKE